MNHRSSRRRDAASAGMILAYLLFGSATTTGQEKPHIETETCINETCHASIIDRAVMHRPAAKGQCLECHDFADPAEHLFELLTEPEELCWECHDLDFEEFVHSPVDEGNCVACHDPHGSDQPAMLVTAPSRGLCMRCHAQDFSGRKYLHGPVAAEACDACHAPHTSAQDKLLLRTPTELCFSCHSDMASEESAARQMHAPMQEGCGTCHDPHKSDERFQLRSALPQLCFSCHEDTKQTLDESSIVHGPVFDAGGCVACHDPHYSDASRFYGKPQAEVCLDCHNKPIKATSGRMLINLSAFLEQNPRRHGPVRDGECAACHEPHASENFCLLVDEYPARFYARFEFERYELCFGCHSEELVASESGTGLTGFRHGNQNLHWLHVNQDKGRTCRACHEVHASRRPFHIREIVPFGAWMFKINFEQTTEGGTCAPGCHGFKRYARDAETMQAQ